MSSKDSLDLSVPCDSTRGFIPGMDNKCNLQNKASVFSVGIYICGVSTLHTSGPFKYMKIKSLHVLY